MAPHSKYINVPTSLLQTVKNDRLEFGLVALSVAVKCVSPSSTYLCHSVRQMRHDLHCGHAKALKLWQAVQQSSLFVCSPLANGGLRIVARSYKSLYGEVRTCHGFTSLHMDVVKVTCQDRQSISITTLEYELRQLMLQNCYHAQMRCDELKMNQRKHPGYSHAHLDCSESRLGQYCGRSARSIIRYNHRLRQAGELRIDSHPLVRVVSDMNHATPAEREGLIEIHNLGFKRQSNDYTLLQRQSFHRHQHIIYGHRRRMTYHLSKSAQPSSSSTTDFFFMHDCEPCLAWSTLSPHR